jgi:hypothetical protein
MHGAMKRTMRHGCPRVPRGEDHTSATIWKWHPRRLRAIGGVLLYQCIPPVNARPQYAHPGCYPTAGVRTINGAAADADVYLNLDPASPEGQRQ